MANPLFSSVLLAPFMRWLGRLGFPKLFTVFAVLFVIDMLVPDPILFVDEILLGLGTLLFASWKDRRKH
jgi:hypothetical protein